MTALAPPARVDVPDAGPAPIADLTVPDDAGERGTLTVDDRVVGRVAGYAVSLVPGAAAPPTRVLGVNIGDADADGDARVRARVDGGTAVVEATIAVGWPASVRSVVERVRESVVREVATTTDVRVDHVDVDVVSLTVPSTRSQRRVR